MAEFASLEHSATSNKYLPWGIAIVGVLAAVAIARRYRTNATPSQSQAAAEIPAALTGAASSGASTSALNTGLQLSDLQNALGGVTTTLQGNIGDLGTGVVNLAKGVATGFSQQQQQISQVAQGVTTGLTKLETDLTGALGKQGNAITALGTSVTAAINGAASQNQTALSTMQTAIQGYLTQAQGAIGAKLDANTAAQATALKNISDALTGAVAGAHNDTAFGVGQNAVNYCMHEWRESCNAVQNAANSCPSGWQAAHDYNPAALLCVGQKLLATAGGG